MKKKILLYVMCLVMLLSAASCSKNEKAKKQSMAANEAIKSETAETPKENAEKESNTQTEENSNQGDSKSPFESIADNSKVDLTPVIPVEVSDATKFEGLTETEKIELEKKCTALIKDIKTSFKSAGMNVSVNETTGEVAVDASVLFSTDEYKVASEGECFLKSFLGVYVPVVTKHGDFISTVMVEGHTDTDGKYDYNMELSKKRAENVLEFCKSGKSGLESKQLSTVKSKFKAVGRSYDVPVYGDGGKVDMAASRRVTFRFIINID